MSDPLSAVIGQFNRNAASPVSPPQPPVVVAPPSAPPSAPADMFASLSSEQQSALILQLQQAQEAANEAPATATSSTDVVIPELADVSTNTSTYSPPAREETPAKKEKKEKASRPRFRRPKQKDGESDEAFAQRCAELKAGYERRLAEYEAGAHVKTPPEQVNSPDPAPGLLAEPTSKLIRELLSEPHRTNIINLLDPLFDKLKAGLP